MAKRHSRRELLKLGMGIGGIVAIPTSTGAVAVEAQEPPRGVLTPADKFGNVARGNPVPHTLRGDALIQARLTPETWRLEIVAEGGAKIAQPVTLDFPALMELGKTHGVKFIKALQCLNIAQPLGQGLWEGVPLREVLRLVGTYSNVRRVHYSGFHNDDPKQIFQSSLSLTEVLETPPWELSPFLAYRLNGSPIPLERGGPVRMIIPWAHGFKSIKWLQRLVLTNDHRANDTYADANNDPESHLKTAAYMDRASERVGKNTPVVLRGTVLSGLSGLKQVEYWLRRTAAKEADLSMHDPAWGTATWQLCRLDAPPSDWRSVLPADVRPTDVWGFDPKTGKPRDWPLRYGMTGWTANLSVLPPGLYEFRARAVDLNGFAQPEPRPNRQTGLNAIEVRRFEVTA
ncbi:molybdopterin-dependent oxidoreductase [Armatimonas sp.]|uniref:molybdopterin-dependent oxidoreductase n=1 Tax=Armatimonas sp. TaxID=1872638 RepID=UPI00375038FE